jgi:hypothetical protein
MVSFPGLAEYNVRTVSAPSNNVVNSLHTSFYLLQDLPKNVLKEGCWVEHGILT